MANLVNMPQIGLNEDSNLISEWNKEEGELVKVGDVLFSIETDKSSMEVESEFEGVLLKKLYDEGDVCEVLRPVCIIGNEGEDISAILEAKPTSEGNQQVEVKSSDDDQSEIIIGQRADIEDSDGVLKISPRARNLAERKGVNVNYAIGTGPEGRIIEKDIYSLINNGPVSSKAASIDAGSKDISQLNGTGIGGRILTSDFAGDGKVEKSNQLPSRDLEEQDFRIDKLSNIRKIIGKNMTQSLQNMAQLTLNSSFDATAIMDYRKIVKAGAENLGLANITLNDMVLYAVSRTVGEFENLNANMISEKEIKVFNNVHLGFACDTDRGLMVPTIFNSNKMSLNQISSTAKDLAAQCQRGNIDPGKLQGGSFTVTNLGSLGIENFTPVINPPETGILGVGSIEYKIKKVREEYREYPAMGLSLTFDHRAIDGAPAARFLQKLVQNLENFNILLAK